MSIEGLIFAQFPSPDNPSSISSLSNPSDHNVGATSMSQLPPEVSGYTELGDGQVMEVLKKYLDLFQSSSNLSGGEEDDYLRKRSGPGITLYREAIEHCARLYRVMVSLACRANLKTRIILALFRIYLELIQFCSGQRGVGGTC